MNLAGYRQTGERSVKKRLEVLGSVNEGTSAKVGKVSSLGRRQMVPRCTQSAVI